MKTNILSHYFCLALLATCTLSLKAEHTLDYKNPMEFMQDFLDTKKNLMSPSCTGLFSLYCS